jgi:hypothetical protein
MTFSFHGTLLTNSLKFYAQSTIVGKLFESFPIFYVPESYSSEEADLCLIWL